MGKWFHSLTFHLSELAIALSCCSLTMAQSDTKASAKEGKVDKMPLKAGPEDKLEKVAPGKVDADASAEFTTTASGLKYRILRKSEGKKPGPKDSVTVHYKGWLDDGTIFDSSYRREKKTSFPLNQVIKGWTEGLQLVGVDGMIELEIPHELGYGERGTPGGPIPPRANLHFVVELFKIGN